MRGSSERQSTELKPSITLCTHMTDVV
jgi:hypothetical protein